MKRKLVTVDAETLLSTPMSKTMFIVNGLIPQEVNALSIVSKISKNWLMLWLGLQVSQGFSVWEISTMHCDVLYLLSLIHIFPRQDHWCRARHEKHGRGWIF